jgi:transcriptional regulator with XRE-family HTH domain
MDLGQYLKNARLKLKLSQLDVAKVLKLGSAQSISDWERNYGSSVPLKTLRKLCNVYRLDENEAFKHALDFQKGKLEQKMRKEFFKNKKK